ncbi:MAG: hypothetical protein IT287_03080 [Bdellovibrionaceae bacterium]|nr:hypothetical protein [Pseudobdellovibrionaceae bacterium]
MSRKSKTLKKLASVFFKLEVTKGHMRWSVADLARISRVSRSLIYRYLGSSKQEIVRNCLRQYLENLYGFSPTSPEDYFGTHFSKNIEKARIGVLECHEALIFYHKWRARDGWICEELKKMEALFQTRLQKLFPNLSGEKIIILYAIIHGLVTAPFIETDLVAKAIDEIASMA